MFQKKQLDDNCLLISLKCFSCFSLPFCLVLHCCIDTCVLSSFTLLLKHGKRRLEHCMCTGVLAVVVVLSLVFSKLQSL